MKTQHDQTQVSRSTKQAQCRNWPVQTFGGLSIFRIANSSLRIYMTNLLIECNTHFDTNIYKTSLKVLSIKIFKSELD